MPTSSINGSEKNWLILRAWQSFESNFHETSSAIKNLFLSIIQTTGLPISQEITTSKTFSQDLPSSSSVLQKLALSVGGIGLILYGQQRLLSKPPLEKSIIPTGIGTLSASTFSVLFGQNPVIGAFLGGLFSFPFSMFGFHQCNQFFSTLLSEESIDHLFFGLKAFAASATALQTWSWCSSFFEMASPEDSWIKYSIITFATLLSFSLAGNSLGLINEPTNTSPHSSLDSSHPLALGAQGLLSSYLAINANTSYQIATCASIVLIGINLAIYYSFLSIRPQTLQALDDRLFVMGRKKNSLSYPQSPLVQFFVDLQKKKAKTS